MDQNIQNSAEKQLKKQSRKKIWKRIVSVLGGIVVFCTTYALILPAITLSDKSYCGVEEHKHSEECYTHNLICKLSSEAGQESGHKHSDACYEKEKALVCGTEESSGHTHSAECKKTEKVLICKTGESQGHSHTDACKAEDGSVVCGEEETSGHTHGASCYEEKTETVCGKSESKGHAHTDACWSEKENLICKQSEGGQSSGHKHNEKCYEEVLKCTLEEHTHKTACFSNPKADVETAADWEKTLPKTLTGDLRKDVLAIADSQLGYRESEDNYIVDEDGKKKGYSRYGDWYGDKYGHWCAMFVSFCMDYAGVEGFPLEANCQQWINKLKTDAYDLYRDADSYDPAAGDVIFFDWDLDGISHHVGLVYSVSTDDKGNVTEVKTIEGNSSDKVKYNTYKASNPQIMGYAVLEEVEVEENENALVFENEQMSVTVVFPEDYKIPEGAVLEVQAVDAEADKEIYEGMAEAVDNTITDEEHRVASLDVYDIKVLVGEDTLEVSEETELNVTINYKEPRYSEEEIGLADEFKIVSIEESEPAAQTYALRRSVEPEEESGYAITENESVFGEVEKGVTSITYATNRLGVMGVAVTNEIKTGNFWKRVDSFDELNKTAETKDTILIVSIEGNIALTYGTNNNYEVPVFLNQVKGNPSYYEITVNSDGSKLTNASQFQVVSKGTNTFQLASLGATNQKVRLNSTANMFGTGTYDLKVEQIVEQTTIVEKEKVYSWRISNGSNGYLSYDPEGNLNVSTTVRNDRRGFLIFKLENTTLTIPGETENEYVPPVIPDPPEYENVEPSGSKKDVTSEIEGLSKFKVQYASDPATSDIEDRFAGTEEDDGKLLTDKSVVYMHDDYNSFEEGYEDGQFGVTLSALGQVPSENYGIGPAMDVVVILDTSYSMLNPSNSVKDEDGNSITRMQWAVDALNDVMSQVLAEDLNRVGLVTFSDASQTVLPLGRYTTQDKIYLELEKDSRGTDNHGRGGYLYDLNVNSNVRDQNGGSVDFVLDYDTVTTTSKGGANWEGTFTQSGIQEAAEILLDNKDTVYNGMPRVPVIIMISDGGPTLCSSNYMSPNSGPIYGNSGNPGNDDYDTSAVNTTAARNNRLGINGYYTILTANYFKRLVSSHYDIKARYMSVGIGIDEDAVQSSSGWNATTTHDNSYCHAVLDPGTENDMGANVSHAVGSVYDGITVEAVQLQNLLNNNYDGKYVAVPNHYSGFNRLSVTHSRVPVLKNPYLPTDKNPDESYDYADTYMEGQASNLAEILMNYLHSIQFREYNWNFVLENETSVEMEDPLGDGMEVQSDLILHFGHNKYKQTSIEVNGNVATYHYDYDPIPHEEAYPKNKDADSKPEGTIYDISTIQVTVTTTGEGLDKKQTVKMVVPDDLLPLMYAERYAKFYYQEHPIRLTYKVGLTEETIQDVQNMKVGERRVYYTNQWDESGTPTTTSEFILNQENTYNLDLQPVDKTENTTETITTSFTSEESNQRVLQKLGNNGRLEIVKEPTSVNVEKVWVGDPGDSVTVYLLADGVVYGEPVTLSSENEWKHTWEVLPKYNEDGDLIEYSISEEYLPGYETEIKLIPKGTEYSVTKWTKADRFENGKDYVLFSQKYKGALAASGENFTWDTNTVVNSNTRPQETTLWRANSNGDVSRLTNRGTGKYMSWNYNIRNSYWSVNSGYFDDVTYNSANGRIYYNGSNDYYFTGIDGNPGSGISGSSDNAISFELYRVETTTRPVDKDIWIITNTESDVPPLDLTIRKESVEGAALAGAKFALYREDANGNVIPYTEPAVTGTLINAEIEVGEEGTKTITIPGEDATYYLIETKAPSGFLPLEKAIRFTVADGRITELEGQGMAEHNNGTITVVNKAAYTLPHTGGNGTTLYLLGGAMLMLSAILIFIKRFFERRYI